MIRDSKIWKQGRSPVGWGVLSPTLICLPKYLIVQWKFLCQVFVNIKYFIYADLCRGEDTPTYGFSNNKSLSAKFCFMPILLNGALENSTLRAFFEERT